MFSYLTGKIITQGFWNPTTYFDPKVSQTIFPEFKIQFCSLLLRRESCSFSNGEYVKAGLAELEQWCHDATEEVGAIDQSPVFFLLSSLSEDLG